MLNDLLNTNEVKNGAGVEVEFERISTNGRTTVFQAIGASPALPHTISVKHEEIGSGLALRRRSSLRVDKTTISTVDNATPVKCLSYVVMDSPVGALNANTEMINVLAELLSLLATKNGSTTVSLDGTGTGSAALLSGSL